ncbi:MAG: PKD domain-containing protein [Balneolales bacterium]|nr:PKD domain-containing protein [Balneolales bacterium]
MRVDDGEGLSNSVTTERLEVLLNRPPVAVVDSGVESCTDQVIIFSSARSFDPDGDSFQTMWDFGDGNTSLEANPVHSYSNPGTYTARITLDDGFSETPTVQEIPVIIEGSPQARIQSHEFTVCANSPVVFDGSGSSDPNGMIGSYSWDFGDMNTAVGEKTTHLFTRPGTYRVTLTITGSGTGNCPNISQATAMVTVVAAPRARFEVPSVVSPGTAISLDASESETADTITGVSWVIRKNGESYAEMSGMRQSFTPDSPGRYEVELTINTDNDAGCSLNTETRVIHVNASPELVWNLPEQWPQFTPFRLSADGSRDGDGYIETYIWKFNGEEIGRGLTTPLPVLTHGNHIVELIARDNSGVGNSEVRLSGEVFVNPAPVPAFELPGVVYSGEKVRLQADQIADLSDNRLSSSWTVNGAVVASGSGSVSPDTDGSTPERSLSENMSLADDGRTLEFTARAARYEVVLTQDDGLGLANSVKSVSKVLLVGQSRPVRPALPWAIIEGERLSASDLGLPDGYVIVDSGEWGADVMLTVGQDLVAGISDADGLEAAAFWSARDGRLFVGWQPRGAGEAILAVYGFEIPVYERLRASESELSYEVDWNPVNSSVLVRAPGVTRSGADVVRYGWRVVGGEVVAEGAEVRLDVTRGRNEFELVITDDSRIRGGSEITIPVVITVE